MPLTLVSRSVEETHQWGALLAQLLHPGDIVALAGELGSGKTELVRGICQGLGCEARVSSPSFVRVHRYQRDDERTPVSNETDRLMALTPFSSPISTVYHADFYLARSLPDAQEYGLEELAQWGGLVIVEWANRYPQLLPEGSLWISLKTEPEEPCWRLITLTRSNSHL